VQSLGGRQAADRVHPGHTPGHESLLVWLDNTAPLLLTGDSVYITEIIDEDNLPALVWSPHGAGS